MPFKKMTAIPSLMILAALTSISLTPAASAKVPAEEAKMLGTTLTPMGAEKSANSANTIPAWTGGITTPPSDFDPARQHTDPFSADKRLFTITAKNMAEYKDNLTAGQMALLSTYPTYAIPVYPTHRSASYPDFVYKATAQNAVNALRYPLIFYD